MSSSSRLRALRPFLAVALVPSLVALLTMGRVGAMLAVMWTVLVLTVGLAVTSQGEQKPNTFDPRGRLHG